MEPNIEKQEKTNFGFYTVVWCTADNWNMLIPKNAVATELSLRKSVPLELLGQSSLRYRSQSKITIIVLEGYEYLSDSYKKELGEANFRIVNYVKKFEEIVSLFPNINKNYNRFERNCFLRWLALKDLAKNDRVSHFLHIDSDMVLYTSLEEIAKETENETFVLEGCPALVSVSDFSWFDIYETEIKKFDANITGYSNMAAHEKKLLPENDLEICNTAVWRNPIGSDQDLLEYLISLNKIPQNKSIEIFNSNLFLVENPLTIQYWAEKQGINKKNKITEKKDGSIYYGSKKIAFTHYQGTFCYYSNIFVIAHYFFPFNILHLETFLYYKIEATKFRIPKIAKYVWKLAKILNLRMERKDFIKYMESYDKKHERRIVTTLNFIVSSKKNILVEAKRDQSLI